MLLGSLSDSIAAVSIILNKPHGFHFQRQLSQDCRNCSRSFLSACVAERKRHRTLIGESRLDTFSIPEWTRGNFWNHLRKFEEMALKETMTPVVSRRSQDRNYKIGSGLEEWCFDWPTFAEKEIQKLIDSTASTLSFGGLDFGKP